MGERVVVALVKFGASSKLGTLSKVVVESRQPYVVPGSRVRFITRLYFISGNRHALSIRPRCPSPVPAALSPVHISESSEHRGAAGLLCQIIFDILFIFPRETSLFGSFRKHGVRYGFNFYILSVRRV